MANQWVVSIKALVALGWLFDGICMASSWHMAGDWHLDGVSLAF
jgi:hypothetical protein